MAIISLSSKSVGDIVKINENSGLVDFIVLQHGYPTSGNGRTLLIRKDIYSLLVWNNTWTQYRNSNAFQLANSYVDNLDVSKLITNVSIDSAGSSIQARGFLLSFTEMGMTDSSIPVEGNPISYFYSSRDRVAQYNGRNTRYWTRTSYNDRYVAVVQQSGTPAGDYPDDEDGLRPAFTLPSSCKIDTGTGQVLANQPPTTPPSITFGTPYAGKSMSVSCGASSDPDGDAITYVFERQIDSRSWTQVSATTSRSITTTCPSSGTRVNFRVKAQDSQGNESGYRTGTAQTIIYNTAPSAPGFINFNIPYAGKPVNLSCGTSADPDGNPITYIFEQQIDSGEWTQVAAGPDTTAIVTCPSTGTTVNYRVKVQDNQGASSGYTTGTAQAIIYNQPPTDPANISYGIPTAGQPLSLTTEGSTDPEGNSFLYVWERSIDSGPWEEIGQTAEKVFTDTVPTSGTMYQARVKAVDSEGGSSGYATGENKAIAYNQPPTAPENIDYGTPRAGAPLILTTAGSTDPEGDSIQYVWEHRVDGGTYTQVAITSDKSVSDTVPETGSKYQARVKAVDSYGNESAYTEGPEKTISYNTPPVISGTDEDKGALTGPFSYQYTVTDAEAAEGEQTLTVTEEVTNGTGASILLRTYTATSGEENTATITTEAWLQLLDGEHTLVITASDGAEEAKRQISFSRSVTRIAASRAITTDKQPEKVFVSLYPSDRPLDSQLTLEVCNNPFDESPVWEDMTLAVDTLVHVFTNKVNTASSYGLAYRLIMTDSAQLVELIQVTLRFA